SVNQVNLSKPQAARFLKPPPTRRGSHPHSKSQRGLDPHKESPMRVIPLVVGLVLLAAVPVHAEMPPSRLIPAQADLVLEVHQPRQLVESITKLDTFKQLQQFAAVKELLDSTQYRRFYQFIAYYEKELG